MPLYSRLSFPELRGLTVRWLYEVSFKYKSTWFTSQDLQLHWLPVTVRHLDTFYGKLTLKKDCTVDSEFLTSNIAPL